MPRAKNAIPSYCCHKPTGQARVRIKGHDYYLGEFGSDASRVKYGQIVARVSSGLSPVDPMAKAKETAAQDQGPSVAELILAFKAHAEKHYVKNDEQTSEVSCYFSCLRIVRELYGLTPAKDFGPLALKAVREKMIEGDPNAKDADGKPCPRKPWSRKNINVMIGRVRRVFKHAVENEMIDESVLSRLQAVAPLLAGRPHGAKDHAKRHAVEQDQIDAVRELVQPLVRDLIDLHKATGARSSELLSLTPGMIDRTNDVWESVLTDHKCVHHGQSRVLYFGPQAKIILEKYLSDDPNEKLFKITRTAYCRAVTRACDIAKIKRWTPHWLRHTYITRTREELGRDAAQAVAGHASGDMTEEYSRNMSKLARKTAAAVG